MKKALRERLSRPLDDHGTAADTRGSSLSYPLMTTASAGTHVVTHTTHSCASVYPTNTLAASSCHISSDLSLGQRRTWAGHGVDTQRAAAYRHDKLPSSSSLHATDSSYSTQRPALTRHLDLRHVAASSSHAHASTANNH